MSKSTRYSVSVHILVLIVIHKNEKLTSVFLAESTNTNPGVIRRIIGMLKKHKLVNAYQGISGTELTRDSSEITLLDIYRAVNPVKVKEQFSINDHQNLSDSLGKNIISNLSVHFKNAETALEKSLEMVTLESVVKDVLMQR